MSSYEQLLGGESEAEHLSSAQHKRGGSYGSTEASHSILAANTKHTTMCEQQAETGSLKEKQDGGQRRGALVVSPRKRKVLLVTMAMMDLAGGMLFGLIGPFFPVVVSECMCTFAIIFECMCTSARFVYK